jgi:hypothetical protein
MTAVFSNVRYENNYLRLIPYGAGQQWALRSLQWVHPSRRAEGLQGLDF